MFGGVGYLVNGNMACGVHQGYLIICLHKKDNDNALEIPHKRGEGF
jgi:hypothetical protein